MRSLLSIILVSGKEDVVLITQYINISTIEVTDLNTSATFATSPADCVARQCSQNVPVRVYWTNTPDETERNNTSNYNSFVTRLLHTTMMVTERVTMRMWRFLQTLQGCT